MTGGERLCGEEREVASNLDFLGCCKMSQGEFFSSFRRGRWLKIEMYGAVGSQVLHK